MHLERGFDGIGYHKVINVNGAVEQGRPSYWIGAHVENHNTGSLGVCLIGTDKFSPEQFNTLESLLRGLKAQYGALDIVGHRDLSPDLDGDGQVEPSEWVKICPGFDVAKFLKERGI
jgi:N-acetyl-anhydromuramyl-L-alanine amidase AmpD